MLGVLSGADLRALKVFVTVAECGGFSSAQAVLNVSQPTISAQISNLEKRLGYRLCERGRAGFQLTNRGAQVLDRAHSLFGSVAEFRSEVNSLADRLIGELSIGLLDNVVTNQSARLAQTIDLFRRRNQHVSLRISINGPVDLERAVIEDRMHLAIGYFGRTLEILNYEPLFSERQLLYCGRGHQLFKQAPDGISKLDLDQSDWVARDYPLGDDIRTFAPPNSSATASHMEAFALLILSGHHIGYLPEHYARAWVESGQLRPILPEAMTYDAAFHSITRKGRRQNRILQTFLQDLKTVHNPPTAE